MTKRFVVFTVLLCALFCTIMPAASATNAPAYGRNTPMPTPQYAGYATQNLAIRAEMSRDAEAIGQYKEGQTVYILAYEPGWLLVVDGNDDSWITGYVLRHTVFDIEPIVDDILPYGATPGTYSCILSKNVSMYSAPDKGSQEIRPIAKGTKLALLGIEDGWAQVIYWRQYGYIYVDAIEELTPVYDTATAQPGDSIAAFISFFNLSEKGLNPNRIMNIEKACEYISIVLEPGQDFSFNGVAGPYRKTRGYFEAPSFVAGETVPSYGGGTCQVSSTLYNALLPLTDGITIVFRTAHGAGGAAYLPHGVDAACGNERIDLKFRNDYPFPVLIEARANDGVLYLGVIKQ